MLQLPYEIILVRHVETDANRILGHSVTGPMHDEPVTFKSGDDTNVALNVYGRALAAEEGILPTDHNDKMCASPFMRTTETAAVIF